MDSEISPAGRQLIAMQHGVISTRQAARAGITDIRKMLRRDAWQRLHQGVYATFPGTPDREAELWAALLRAGPDAVLCLQTAAERHGLLSQPSEAIHIAVGRTDDPARNGKIPGVVIHRSDALVRARHPALTPPCTRVEDTVLDLIKTSGSIDQAYDWICRAIGRRRTTAERIGETLRERKRFPDREEIELALGDASDGVLSILERRYVRGVERAHGLPEAVRQRKVRGGGKKYFLDNLYDKYMLCVELDGTTAHPADEQWRDKRRDRANLAAARIVTIRIGYLDVCDQSHRCQTAAEVAAILSGRGPVVGNSCGAGSCPLPGRRPLSRHSAASRP